MGTKWWHFNQYHDHLSVSPAKRKRKRNGGRGTTGQNILVGEKWNGSSNSGAVQTFPRRNAAFQHSRQTPCTPRQPLIYRDSTFKPVATPLPSLLTTSAGNVKRTRPSREHLENNSSSIDIDRGAVTSVSVTVPRID